MKKYFSIFIMLFSIPVFSYANYNITAKLSSDSNSKKNSNQLIKKSVGICKNKTYIPIYLHSITLPSDISFIKETFPLIKKVVAPKNSGPGYRLDLCLDDIDNVTTKSLTWLRPFSKGKLEFLIPTQKIDAISEAVFTNDFSKINARFYNKKTDEYVRLKGWIKNGKSIITIIQESRPSSAVIGTFVLGDFPQNTHCDFGSDYIEEIFSFAKTKISVQLCSYFSSGTAYYKYLKIEVVDKDERLPPEIIGKKFVLTSNDIKNKSVFKYYIGHHNSCDRFELKLNHGSYVFTKFQAGMVIPGMELGKCEKKGKAPSRPCVGESADTKRGLTCYGIKYKSETHWNYGFFKLPKLYKM